MCTDSSDHEQRSLLEELAESYVAQYRQGQKVDIDDFVIEYPELESDIRELFPVMLMLDQGAQSLHKSQSSPLQQLDKSNVGTGSQLGDYILRKPIGQGGMGVVYEAEHITLHSKVAVKILPRSIDRPKLRGRFLREASAAARMSHPNIVRVFGYGSEGTTHYYVMSLVEGIGLDQLISARPHPPGSASEYATRIADQYRSLTHHILDPHSSMQLASEVNRERKVSNKISGDGKERSDGSESLKSTIVEASGSWSSSASNSARSLWEWVAHVGAQAADALAYAHELGVIHRDVKPSNLLIDASDKLFVTDFGLAKLTDDSSLTETGDLLGTLRYMPPEALDGNSDERGDIYGLGLTLYELLAGEPAFGNVDRGKLFHDIANGDVVPLHKRAPKVPRDLAQIIRKSIEPDPSLRYASACALRDDLKRFLAGEPITARPASMGYRTTRWIGRNRLVSAMAGLFLLIMGIATLAAISNARGFQRLAEEKQQESQAAMTARNAAVEQALVTKTTLLASYLAEAQASSTSTHLERSIKGLASLREAIRLARALGQFESHRDDFNSVAALLVAQHDLESKEKWRHQEIISHYSALDFNGDTTEYAYAEDNGEVSQCKIFKVVDGQAVLIETIPLDGRLHGQGFQFSDDGRLLAEMMHLEKDGKTVLQPWVYDRQRQRTFFPDPESADADVGRPMKCFSQQPSVAYLNANHDLVIFNVDNQSRKLIDLPDFAWSNLDLSRDDNFATAFQLNTSHVAVINLQTHEVKKLEMTRDRVLDITALAWRPDGKQLAMATGGELNIWDFALDRLVHWFPHHETVVTELAYIGNGQLLAASGWRSATHIYDPIGEKLHLRCESFFAAASTDGNAIVLHRNEDFERMQVHVTDIVSEFAEGGINRRRVAGIHDESGTLWFAMTHKLAAVDFIGNRYIFANYPSQSPDVAVDPTGQNVFAQVDGEVRRLPIRRRKPEGILAAANEDEPDGFVFGPTQSLLKAEEGQEFRPERLLVSSDGSKLSLNSSSSRCEIVLSRDDDWNIASHSHSAGLPRAVAAHHALPIVSTSTHHSKFAEVRNTETEELLLLLPWRETESCFSPDGSKLLVAAGGSLRSYQVGSWELLRQSQSKLRLKSWIALSADSRWILMESLEPRGAALLDVETLEVALLLPGNPLSPESTPGCISPAGRFLATERGLGTIGVWDLYKLRQQFESLDLEWPLPGLGNATPVRDAALPVEIIWEPNE